MKLRLWSATSSSLPFLAALFVLAPTEGCAREDEDDEEEASATTTSALQAQSQAGLTEGVVDTEGSLAPDPEEAARKVLEFPTRGLLPEGCATKTREANVVTLKLANCTGPFGKVVVNGSLVATFSRAAQDLLHVAMVSAEGTVASGKPLTYKADADVRFEGGQRFLTYAGRSSGTTARGRSFARQTDLSIVADVTTHCASIDGVSKGTVGRYEVDLTIQGFKGCRDACPTAGLARATVDGPLIKDASVEVTFDGSDRARVKIDARRKRELTVTMDCAAAEAVD
jgi:hypothetical protein